MYLSTENCFKLDEIIKSFEVAYRSHIAEALVTRFTTLNDFSIAINQLDSSIETSYIILSHKYKNKLRKIKNEVGNHYTKIQKCHSDYLNGDYSNNPVPYVSDLIDYINFFFNECFKDLTNGFTTIEEFKDYSSKYQLLRNNLSHPASSKILIHQSKEVINFIRRQIFNIDDNKFWFVQKKNIISLIEIFIKNIEDNPLQNHNLFDISFKHRKLLCRDNELQTLKEFILGKEKGYRKSGSVAIYGYGGVGKTALVLEFIYQLIKDLNDGGQERHLDAIFFYTAKEEVLDYSHSSGVLYINEIRKQISSFNGFKDRLLLDLKTSNISDTTSNTVVIIDNIETIPVEEHDLIFDFIKQSPRNIQYIVTSRNEEPCEDKINIKEFKDAQLGIDFIDEFISSNNLDVYIEVKSKHKLLKASKGNTLILVLSLLMLNSNTSSVQGILSELESIESANIEVIADFMYKNTINQTIKSLVSDGHDPIKVLKIISLYEVPIDLYSISKLSEVNISSVDTICKLLAEKLILEKINESFTLNEFSNKFIFIKYLPDKIEKRDIKNKIRQHKRELANQLSIFEERKRIEPILRSIMEDWKPKNSIDTIAIASSYILFGDSKVAVRRKDAKEVKRIREEFSRNEKMTSHPYIRFQKARTYSLFLEIFKRPSDRKAIINDISRSYEEAIEATDFYYPYIKNTKSYGSINWIYGLFIQKHKNESQRAIRYLEDGYEVFKKLKIVDKSFFTLLNSLSGAYKRRYIDTKDKRYLIELSKLYDDLIANSKKAHIFRFDVERYKKNFQYHVYKVNKRRNNYRK